MTSCQGGRGEAAEPFSYACGFPTGPQHLRVVTVCAVSVCRRLGDRKNLYNHLTKPHAAMRARPAHARRKVPRAPVRLHSRALRRFLPRALIVLKHPLHYNLFEDDRVYELFDFKAGTKL